MSEATFPFGSAGGPAGQGKKSVDKRAMILIGVAGALALAVAVWFLFLSGGSKGGSDSFTPLPRAAATPSAPGASAASTPAAAIPAAFEGTVVTNPFKPYVVEPADASGVAPGAGGVAPTTGGIVPTTPAPTATWTPPAPPTTTPTPTPTPTATPTPTPTGPTWLTLVSADYDTGKAVVVVDHGLEQTVTTGNVFSVYFKLVAIAVDDNGTVMASFKYGDLYVTLGQGVSVRL